MSVPSLPHSPTAGLLWLKRLPLLAGQGWWQSVSQQVSIHVAVVTTNDQQRVASSQVRSMGKHPLLFGVLGT